LKTNESENIKHFVFLVIHFNVFIFFQFSLFIYIVVEVVSKFGSVLSP